MTNMLRVIVQLYDSGLYKIQLAGDAGAWDIYGCGAATMG